MGAGVSRLRLLVLTTSYPTPDAPVAGIFVREYVRAVLPHCDPIVVHLDRSDIRRPTVDQRDDDGVPTVRARYPARPRALAPFRHLAAARRALRLVDRHDLVHAHFFLAAFPAVLLQRRPVVVTEHWSVFLPEDPARLSPPFRLAAKWALERAAMVLPVSEPLERGLRAHGIRARTRVLPNVVDEALFHLGGPPSSGAPRLLTVGLFYEAKGVDILLEAVARLGVDVHLDIVGDGRPRTEYEALAHRLGIADRVAFHGLLPKAQVAELMRRAHLYVSASRYENNPVVLLEALACGLPVVATAVGGVPDIVGADGLLAQPEPGSVAVRIEEALERLDEFDSAAIARRAAERYGARRIGTELAALYAEVLAAERA